MLKNRLPEYKKGSSKIFEKLYTQLNKALLYSKITDKSLAKSDVYIVIEKVFLYVVETEQ